MASNELADHPVLTVVMNGQAVIECDRRKSPASRQQLFLEHRDRDMDSGFNLDGRQEVSPDLLTRARFVATSLVQAREAQNDSAVAANCAYLWAPSGNLFLPCLGTGVSKHFINGI